MKPHGLIFWLVSAIAGASLVSAQEFLFSFEAFTDPPGAEVLFVPNAEGGLDPAPVGTTLWFVADTMNDGISAVQGGAIQESDVQKIEQGTGPDKRFFDDTVDGIILGNQPGKYRSKAIDVVDSWVADSNIQVFLWHDVNMSGTIGDRGDTFGILDLGIRPPPAELGNAEYIIATDIRADQVTVIPEPAAGRFLFAVLCLLGGLFRLRTRST